VTPDPRARAGRRAQGAPSLAARIAFASVANLLGLLALEGVLSVALSLKDARDEPLVREALHSRHDPDLGWSHKPSVYVGDLYGPGKSLSTNALGLRAREEYTREVPAGRYRVLCVGDSFTLGYGVDDSATYEAKLEALDPRLQVVNMGQGGYGVDQAYLWYQRDGARLEHDLVVFAFIAPDFERMLDERFNDVLEKPLLRAQNGALAVENTPVPEGSGGAGGLLLKALRGTALGELYRRLTERGTPLVHPDAGKPLPFLEVGELVLQDLVRLTRERRSALALVQLPLRDRVSGRPIEVSAWVHNIANRAGVPFLDLTEAFDALPKGDAELYYQPDGHLNALGNALVAEHLREGLARSVPGFPGG
jgi:lysophospholipase L1-like esterase